MKTQEILNATAHRPWELPNGNWKYYQEWDDSLFAHWQVDLKELERFVPKALTIDTFEGKPWVSLVAFTLKNLRPKNLPPFPPLSNFYEINIRTYVKFNNKPGIYFLSIESGKWLSAQFTRAIMELPYRYSHIKRHTGVYQSVNKKYKDSLHLTYQIGQRKTQKTALEKWLTERYTLFQESKNAINAFDIHHVEWPLKNITFTEFQMDYPRFNNLINNKPPLVHYSNGVQVLTWNKKKNRL